MDTNTIRELIGNNHLISIAFFSESPNQAAKVTQVMGFSKNQIRAVRNAAVVKRDKGIEEFNKYLMPYQLTDIDIQFCKTMTLDLSIKKTYEHRPLNAVEFNEIALFITDELKKRGIECKIQLKPSNPLIKSNIKL